jgi:hypothetical protein
MHWELLIALIIAVPIILFPAAYLWYINIGGIHSAVMEAKARRIAREQAVAQTVAINESEHEKEGR